MISFQRVAISAKLPSFTYFFFLSFLLWAYFLLFFYVQLIQLFIHLICFKWDLQVWVIRIQSGCATNRFNSISLKNWAIHVKKYSMFTTPVKFAIGIMHSLLYLDFCNEPDFLCKNSELKFVFKFDETLNLIYYNQK